MYGNTHTLWCDESHDSPTSLHPPHSQFRNQAHESYANCGQKRYFSHCVVPPTTPHFTTSTTADACLRNCMQECVAGTVKTTPGMAYDRPSKRRKKSTFLKPSKRDEYGLFPLDYLIMSLHRDNGKRNPLESIRNLIRRCPETVATSNGFGPSQNSFHVSPLIRLLSQGNSIASCHYEMYQFENEHAHHTSRDCETERIVECAKLLLSANPDLISVPSLTTKCTPLHKALIYYGEATDLVKLLLQFDTDGALLLMRNRFGDLPVHVATTVGVPGETLRLILERTVVASATSSLRSQLSCTNKSTLVWSSNDSGFTPIYLAWMRHIDGGGSYPQRRRTGGGLYTSLWKEAKNQLYLSTVSSSSPPERVSTARLVLGGFWDVVVTTLESTCVKGIIPITGQERCQSEIREKIFRPLHTALALTCTNNETFLMFSILDVLLLTFRHQLNDQDEYGRLPLHYAAASNEYSTMPWSENNMEEERVSLPVSIWNRIPTGWSELIRREPAAQHQDSALPANTSEKKRQSVIQVLLKHHPRGAAVADKCGFLPLHFAIESEKIWMKKYEKPSKEYKVASSAVGEGSEGDDRKARSTVPWAENITALLNANPESLERRDPKYHLYPFMQAAVGTDSSIDTVYRLLRMSPALVMSGNGT